MWGFLRTSFVATLGAILVGAMLVAAPVASADPIKAHLHGYEEVPAVSTPGSGDLRASTIDQGTAIAYSLTYSGLEGTVTQAHFHFGRRATNGGISVWICANNPPIMNAPAGTPPCPQEGTIEGVITPESVVGPGGAQQLGAGEFDEFVAAMRAGAVYANVHTTLSPGGEIRGQVRAPGSARK